MKSNPTNPLIVPTQPNNNNTTLLPKSSDSLENYDLVKIVGKGRFSVVYKAERLSDHTIVALKRISREHLDTEAKQRRVADELKLASALDCKHIARYLTCFMNHGELYIVLAWCDGGDLRRLMRRHREASKFLSERLVMNLFVQLMRAVAHMHERKIIHRDLKPANCLLCKDGTLKVCDFGLGRILLDGVSAHSRVGTPLYMAPEVLLGGEQGYDGSSDIWSIGCILYELCALRHPFSSSGDTDEALLARVKQRDPQLDYDLVLLIRRISRAEFDPLPPIPKYSENIKQMINSTLSLNPMARPSSQTILVITESYISELTHAAMREARSPSSPSSGVNVIPGGNTTTTTTTTTSNTSSPRGVGGGGGSDTSNRQLRGNNTTSKLASSSTGSNSPRSPNILAFTALSSSTIASPAITPGSSNNNNNQLTTTTTTTTHNNNNGDAWEKSSTKSSSTPATVGSTSPATPSSNRLRPSGLVIPTRKTAVVAAAVASAQSPSATGIVTTVSSSTIITPHHHHHIPPLSTSSSLGIESKTNSPVVVTTNRSANNVQFLQQQQQPESISEQPKSASTATTTTATNLPPSKSMILVTTPTGSSGSHNLVRFPSSTNSNTNNSKEILSPRSASLSGLSRSRRYSTAEEPNSANQASSGSSSPLRSPVPPLVPPLEKERRSSELRKSGFIIVPVRPQTPTTAPAMIATNNNTMPSSSPTITTTTAAANPTVSSSNSLFKPFLSSNEPQQFQQQQQQQYFQPQQQLNITAKPSSNSPSMQNKKRPTNTTTNNLIRHVRSPSSPGGIANNNNLNTKKKRSRSPSSPSAPSPLSLSSNDHSPLAGIPIPFVGMTTSSSTMGKVPLQSTSPAIASTNQSSFLDHVKRPPLLSMSADVVKSPSLGSPVFGRNNPNHHHHHPPPHHQNFPSSGLFAGAEPRSPPSALLLSSPHHNIPRVGGGVGNSLSPQQGKNPFTSTNPFASNTRKDDHNPFITKSSSSSLNEQQQQQPFPPNWLPQNIGFENTNTSTASSSPKLARKRSPLASPPSSQVTPTAASSSGNNNNINKPSYTFELWKTIPKPVQVDYQKQHPESTTANSSSSSSSNHHPNITSSSFPNSNRITNNDNTMEQQQRQQSSDLVPVITTTTTITTDNNSKSNSTTTSGSNKSGGTPYEIPAVILGDMIGEGSFARVYRAVDSTTGSILAVKELELMTSEVESVVKEIGLLSNLQHPNLVRYLGSSRGPSKHILYVHLEFCNGGSIAQMLHQFKSFPERLIRLYTRQMVEALVYLHSRGIVHRDIKGGNVLVDGHESRGVVKLSDFGTSLYYDAAMAEQNGSGGVMGMQILGRSSRRLEGTVLWMAPEVARQAEGSSLSPASDIWSLGATVIEMATGHPPWKEEGFEDPIPALYRIATTTVPPRFPSNLSPAGHSFLTKCMAVDPKERATAKQLALHNFLTLESDKEKIPQTAGIVKPGLFPVVGSGGGFMSGEGSFTSNNLLGHYEHSSHNNNNTNTNSDNNHSTNNKTQDVMLSLTKSIGGDNNNNNHDGVNSKMLMNNNNPSGVTTSTTSASHPTTLVNPTTTTSSSATATTTTHILHRSGGDDGVGGGINRRLQRANSFQWHSSTAADVNVVLLHHAGMGVGENNSGKDDVLYLAESRLTITRFMHMLVNLKGSVPDQLFRDLLSVNIQLKLPVVVVTSGSSEENSQKICTELPLVCTNSSGIIYGQTTVMELGSRSFELVTPVSMVTTKEMIDLQSHTALWGWELSGVWKHSGKQFRVLGTASASFDSKHSWSCLKEVEITWEAQEFWNMGKRS
jgi:serine/threonine protein kinase